MKKSLHQCKNILTNKDSHSVVCPNFGKQVVLTHLQSSRIEIIVRTLVAMFFSATDFDGVYLGSKMQNLLLPLPIQGQWCSESLILGT